MKQWLVEKTAGMRPPYIPPGRRGIHPAIARASKDIASRYIQLKTRHAATGYFLHKIKAVDTAACEWCSAEVQTTEHLWTQCREWSSQRRRLREALNKQGIRWYGTPNATKVASIVAKDRAVGPLLKFLQHTKVGQRAATEQSRDVWEERMLERGLELLNEQGEED